MGFCFVDRQGVSWMVLLGLPDGHPSHEELEGGGAGFAGLTFRASHGVLRVLARSEIPASLAIGLVIPTPSTVERARHPDVSDWEALLERSTPWPQTR